MKLKVIFIAIFTVVVAVAGVVLMSTTGVFAKSAAGPALAANGHQDQESTAAAPSAEHGESTVEPARETVLDVLPQVAPHVGPPREIPDHPEAGEMEGYKNTPIPGAKGEPSPRPRIGVLEQTPGASVFTGQGESACQGYIPSDHALATSSSYVVQVLTRVLRCITRPDRSFRGIRSS